MENKEKVKEQVIIVNEAAIVAIARFLGEDMSTPAGILCKNLMGNSRVLTKEETAALEVAAAKESIDAGENIEESND